MDKDTLNLLSVETLRRIQMELAGYLQGQLFDLRSGNILQTDLRAFEDFVEVERVMAGKE